MLHYKYRDRIKTDSTSYFRQCKYCGKRIHLRKMPYGQWVAFDASDSVHKCSRHSQYDDLLFITATKNRISNNPTPQSSLSKPKVFANLSNINWAKFIKKIPKWFWWVTVGLLLLLYITFRISE